MTISCRPSRTRFPVWVLAGTSLALLLAGCGGAPVIDVSTESPSSTVSTPSSTAPSDAVHWLDGFCGAVNGFLADNNAMQAPATDVGDDGRKVLSKMLGDYITILDKAIDRLAALPPVSDPVGQAAKKTFVGNYTSARDMATSARTQLDAASPTDFDAQTSAAEALVSAQQTALSAVSPEMAIMTSPELRAAVTSAHRCTSTS